MRRLQPGNLKPSPGIRHESRNAKDGALEDSDEEALEIEPFRFEKVDASLPFHLECSQRILPARARSPAAMASPIPCQAARRGIFEFREAITKPLKRLRTSTCCIQQIGGKCTNTNYGKSKWRSSAAIMVPTIANAFPIPAMMAAAAARPVPIAEAAAPKAIKAAPPAAIATATLNTVTMSVLFLVIQSIVVLETRVSTSIALESVGSRADPTANVTFLTIFKAHRSCHQMLRQPLHPVDIVSPRSRACCWSSSIPLARFATLAEAWCQIYQTHSSPLPCGSPDQRSSTGDRQSI